ncbi:MAG: biopolymer transporter ExbD [Verrucomicrobiae bacterium]|nr:biopolymer transporter ExbD [Verrucomicrobiae bacterium]MCP5539735.1 biopolymer transporter ExbD [Akkermansiaceae bacterium]MCP5549472.1 biopolymer transporter ExbD [Akkermansiaceae bacterium]
MRTRKFTSPRDAEENRGPSLEISSLIDVSFLLLIYFLVTSTLDPKEADLALNVRESKPEISRPVVSGDTGSEPLRIHVAENGVVLVNDEALDSDSARRSLPLLTARLREIRTALALLSVGAEPNIVVSADDSVPAQRFVDVMNCLAGEKIARVTIEGFQGE